MYKLIVLFSFLLLIISCKNITENNDEKKDSLNVESQLKIEKKDIAPNNQIDEIQKPPKDYVIFEKDTVFINETGKILNINKLNENLYYYNIFIATKPETGIGKSFIKVRNKKDSLLWKKEFDNKRIISDGNESIIFIDVERNVIEYYDAYNGKKTKSLLIDKKYIIGDANDFVATENGIYIKLVNDDDYSFKNILFLNKLNGENELLDYSRYRDRYLNLKKENNKVILLENNDVLSFDIEKNRN